MDSFAVKTQSYYFQQITFTDFRRICRSWRFFVNIPRWYVKYRSVNGFVQKVFIVEQDGV